MPPKANKSVRRPSHNERVMIAWEHGDLQGCQLPAKGRRRGTVVLLHGLATDHRCWGRIVPQQLSDAGYEVILPDLPGFGDSPEPDGRTPIIAYSVEQLLAALPPGQVILVGHSYGASIAAELALAAPEQIAGLILLTPGIFPHNGLGGSWAPDLGLQVARALNLLPQGHGARTLRLGARAIKRAERTIGPRVAGRAAVLRAITKRLTAQHHIDDEAASELAQAYVGAHATSRALAAAGRSDLPRRLDQLTTPTWLIRGARDLVVPPRQLEMLAQHIPNLKGVQIYSRVGHLPMIEVPAVLAQDLMRMTAAALEAGASQAANRES